MPYTTTAKTECPLGNEKLGSCTNAHGRSGLTRRKYSLSTAVSAPAPAINIGAERIGHGLAAEFDPQPLEVLAHKQIPIEINVTSNIRTGCCPTYEEHPLRRYFDAGLMVTLNSDDPPMFGANLLDEYILAHTRYDFTLEQLRELAANAVEASFLPPTRKLDLLRQVEQYR